MRGGARHCKHPRAAAKQLAAQLQTQPQVINEYESGKAIPNNQMIAKIERALGAKLPRVAKK